MLLPVIFLTVQKNEAALILSEKLTGIGWNLVHYGRRVSTGAFSYTSGNSWGECSLFIWIRVCNKTNFNHDVQFLLLISTGNHCS